MFEARGFHGEYEITVTKDRRSRTIRATVGKEERTLRIKL